jgi:hypothetical protein
MAKLPAMLLELDPNYGIKLLASKISNQPLGLAVHRPEAWAFPTRCFENVLSKVDQAEGRAQFGWMFHYRIVAEAPSLGYIIAVHHAVWHAPSGHLIDVTPFHDNPKHYPVTAKGDVLFLVDDGAQPVVIGNLIAPLPSRFFPLSDDEFLVNYVDRLAKTEQESCRALYETLNTTSDQ